MERSSKLLIAALSFSLLLMFYIGLQVMNPVQEDVALYQGEKTLEKYRPMNRNLKLYEFSQILSLKIGKGKETEEGRALLLGSLKECLEDQSTPFVQALCFIEARSLSSKYPEFEGLQEEAVNLLSEPAFAMVREFDYI